MRFPYSWVTAYSSRRVQAHPYNGRACGIWTWLHRATEQQGQPVLLPAQRRAVSPLAHRDLRDGEGETDAHHHLDPDEPRFEVRLRRDEHGLIDDAEAKAEAQGVAVDGRKQRNHQGFARVNKAPPTLGGATRRAERRGVGGQPNDRPSSGTGTGTVGAVGAVVIAVSSGMAASGTLGGVTGSTGAAGGGVTGVGTLLNSGRSSPAGNIGVTGWGGFRFTVAPNSA